MRFGILSPPSRRLEGWQQEAVTLLSEAGGVPVTDGDPVAPDFWLDFGGEGAAGTDLAGERWSFQGSPRRAYAGAGTWQEVVLSDGQRELHRARVALHPKLETSVQRWREVAAQLPARALRQWRAMGPSSFRPTRDLGPPAPEPSWAAVAWRSLERRARDAFADLFEYDIWNVGTLDHRVSAIEDLAGLAEPAWLPARPSLRFLADPFPIGDDAFLVEEYGHGRRSRGRIFRVDSRGDCSLELEEPFHLSYPALVSEGGELYLVPESGERQQCRLYRREGDRWVLDQVLLEGQDFLDPTFFQHEGRWWMFCSDLLHGRNARLLAFHALTLRGPWEPHALNPLKWDVGGARPGGPVFRRRGVLLRPGQDCSETYGGGIVVFRILELAPDRFREEPVARLEPGPGWAYPDGLHHLVVEEGRLVVDAKRTYLAPLFWLERLLREG